MTKQPASDHGLHLDNTFVSVLIVISAGPVRLNSCRSGQYLCLCEPTVDIVQQQSKVCIQTCALLYIAAFCCTANCHGIVSQLITGNYVIKFKRNSFRFQLSARGIATCFASAQPKAQVSGGVDCLCLCLPSKSKSQIATTLANFLAPASDCTENRGLLVAQALLQLTAKLAQQENSLSSVKMLWLTAHCFAAQTGCYKRKLACFYRALPS